MNFFVNALFFGLFVAVSGQSHGSYGSYVGPSNRGGRKPGYNPQPEPYYCKAPSFALVYNATELEEAIECVVMDPYELDQVCKPEIEPIILEAEVELCAGRPLLLQTSVTSEILIKLAVPTLTTYFTDLSFEASGFASLVLKGLTSSCEGNFTQALNGTTIISKLHALDQDLFSEYAFDTSSAVKLKFPEPHAVGQLSLEEIYEDSSVLNQVFTVAGEEETVCKFTWEFEVMLEAIAKSSETVEITEQVSAEVSIESMKIFVAISG
mmetsp:Transcript_25135/g.32653  ORF Transcript_25135/g.32653 Transcript_25135/m.32653 type:complete len:266 (-) Transcript_25135:95-892(-)